MIHLAPLEIAVSNVHAKGAKLLDEAPNQLPVDEYHGNQRAQVEHNIEQNTGKLDAKKVF